MANAFLIYTPADAGIARRIADNLEADGMNIWAEWDEMPSTPAEVEGAIRLSDLLLFLVSKASLKDLWEKQGFRRMLARARGSNHLKLIPVLLKGHGELPHFLSQIEPVDFTQSFATSMRSLRKAAADTIKANLNEVLDSKDVDGKELAKQIADELLVRLKTPDAARKSSQVEKLLIFLASPGDVQTEREHVEHVVSELNRSVAAAKNFIVQVVSWKSDAYPGYGKDAQALLNDQIAEMTNYALFVGILWNRLGTPTSRAGSGTVEEFDAAVEASKKTGRPDIWVYFRQSPSILTTGDELKQRRKVLAFQKRVKEKGLPWSYGTPSDFREMFRTHLTLWLNSRDAKGRARRKRGL